MLTHSILTHNPHTYEANTNIIPSGRRENRPRMDKELAQHHTAQMLQKKQDLNLAAYLCSL